MSMIYDPPAKITLMSLVAITVLSTGDDNVHAAGNLLLSPLDDGWVSCNHTDEF